MQLDDLICAGESDSLVALLQRSTSAAQRMQVLECLQRETPDTRAKLAGDAPCLGALEEWVLDLTEDRMSFHVLETLLKVKGLLQSGCRFARSRLCTQRHHHSIGHVANAVFLAAV